MIVEFGYYDSFGRLAPICATKDLLFDSSVITTYISTLNEIDIVRLVLDDLKNLELTWEYIGTEAFDAYIDHDRVKVGFDLLDGYDEYDEIDDERDHTEYLIPRKELTYLLERWLAFIQKPITEPNYIEIVDSIEFGYCDSSGKLAPRCVAKDLSDNARRAIATYISTLNDIDIVRLVLDDLKNSELTWKYIGTEAFEAFIDHNRVKLGFDLLDKCDKIDDESDHTEYLIPRKKLTYLLERWLAFIQKPIPDPDYVEIIDSEDAYK